MNLTTEVIVSTLILKDNIELSFPIPFIYALNKLYGITWSLSDYTVNEDICQYPAWIRIILNNDSIIPDSFDQMVPLNILFELELSLTPNPA